MLFDRARHEPLVDAAWDPQRARAAIDWIVRDAEASYSPGSWWPVHPRDLEPGEDPAQVSTTLYFGAAGVVWALRYLRARGADGHGAGHRYDLDLLREQNRAWLRGQGSGDHGSFLMGELPVDLMAWVEQPSDALAGRLAGLIEANLDHPARELMWGSPGSLLAATFLHERSGDPRWRDLFRRVAARLEEQLLRSEAHRCDYWTQDLYGVRSTYLGGVHGFVATASALIRGRHLLEAGRWPAWQRRIAETVAHAATQEDGMANWRPELVEPAGRPPKMLMQFCHGAPGVVICLGDFPGTELDELLLAAGEAVWAAGPLAKGANLCHGTAGNGYAFLKLFTRTGDPKWLQRARAFAMHALGQAEVDAALHGRLRYSLWTGDPGLAVYLCDCLRERAAFPTLDVF